MSAVTHKPEVVEIVDNDEDVAMSENKNETNEDKKEESASSTSTTTTQDKDSKKKKKKKDKKKKDKKKKKKKKNKHRNLPPGYKRVQKELQQLLLDPPIGVSACPVASDDILNWIATIEGPEGTPYHGGKFYLSIKFGENYPFTAPKVTFKTKIYHCNVRSTNGEICLDVLKDNYSPALTIEKILLSLCALLQCPNPDDPLVGEIANVYMADKEAHDNNAREWTRRYAMIGTNKAKKQENDNDQNKSK
eukprot:CAMPEP_0201573040 /NCGR_PEP_ID=MMETSP0190_2-20130828/16675_1 /ASSEMBLY_ACC=CAM_ASM_000263 /TAXON_ID=37353 /ORGANISM="Rosalina sp." /LENGTH=247 /DNA_ID=CAMNT_0047999525 /DNA_START=91 /DNA_END=834 /DNA_ORIENTATION=-